MKLQIITSGGVDITVQCDEYEIFNQDVIIIFQSKVVGRYYNVQSYLATELK